MDPFRSERLVYVAYNKEKHDNFMRELHSDAASWGNSTASLLTPVTDELHEGSMKYITNQPLFVIICRIAPDAPTDGDESSGQASTGEKLQPIGELALKRDGGPSVAHHGNLDLGIGIHKDFQGKGYGTEAIKWALGWAFDYANAHRVELIVFGWNTKAYALYRRVGFREEGRKRERLRKHGKYWDVIEMGILEQEWRALKGEPLPLPLCGEDAPDSQHGNSVPPENNREDWAQRW